MNKLFALGATLAVFGVASTASAINQGGFTGPTIDAVTVAEAKNLSDDTSVIMVGKLEKSLGGEKYTFTDATGSITVEIDNDDWNGVTAGAEDLVEIRGDVDKGFTSIEIDVDTITKKQ